MSLLPKTYRDKDVPPTERHIGTRMSRLLKRAYAVEATGALWKRENSFWASNS